MRVIFQALDDVAAWAEKGIAPPRSTNYGVTEDSQVTVPETRRLAGEFSL